MPAKRKPAFLSTREKLEAILEATGWTVPELAAEIGCSRQNVYLLLNAADTGVGSHPSYRVGESVARLYAQHVE